MPLALVSAWLATAMLQSPAPPGDDAFIAIRANLSTLRDVEFVYEGRYDLANAENFPEVRAKAAPDRDYQGTYAFRTADAATYLDIYHQPRREGMPFIRTTECLFASKLDKMEYTPDRARKGMPISHGNGGPGSFNTIESPEPVVPFWIYREILLDPAGYSYKPLDLEEVDGHKCRKIQVAAFYQCPLSDQRWNYHWIDLERGGLPLKIEYTINGRVTRRTHKIELRSFKADDGHIVWVPIAGETDIFSRELGEVAGRHFGRDTCRLVPTSVRINQGLADEYFSIKRDHASSYTGVMEKARREFEGPTAKKWAGEPVRTDPKSVRDRLAANLKEADRQATEIEASSAARESSRWPRPSTLVLLGAGAVALVVGFLLWRRR